LLVQKGNMSGTLKARIPLNISINEKDINEYERSIELIVKYFKGNTITK